MRFKNLLLVLIILLSGCKSFNIEKDLPKILLPLNVVAGYFGTVGVHEGGHAATGAALGGDNIEVDMLPGRDSHGDFHFALTTVEIDRNWSSLDETLFLTMGPTASFLAHVSARELLKTGHVPRSLQPTIAWFGLCNSLSYYFHVSAGLMRIESTDLGKQDTWISCAMLLGALTYDLYDIFSDDGNYFNVLVGEGYYKPKEDRLSVFASPNLDGGGFLGLRVRF